MFSDDGPMPLICPTAQVFLRHILVGALSQSGDGIVRADPDRERPRDVPAVRAADLAGHLRALAEAGADEAILVLDPITESSIRALHADGIGVNPDR